MTLKWNNNLVPPHLPNHHLGPLPFRAPALNEKKKKKLGAKVKIMDCPNGEKKEKQKNLLEKSYMPKTNKQTIINEAA